MQKLMMPTVVLAWAGLCWLACLAVTRYHQSELWWFMWLATCLSPFLMAPLALLMRRFSRQACVCIRKKHRVHIHLNPWQPTGNLSPARVAWFWRGLIQSMTSAVQEPGATVVIASHLLTPHRIRLLRKSLPTDLCHCHVLPGRRSVTATLALQLDTLLKQWRRINPSQPRNPVLVIRRKSFPAKK